MSFISVEPQSRVFLESHSKNLLTQFDIQLEIIADRYLAFFQERRRIEVSYISSLRKLHREATVIDAPFDPRAEPTTTRTAWDKVRDSLEGEANTQQAFVDVLDHDVIKPLETEDRTRKRVEEGLEKSAAKYADHAENTILKLQQAYLKKHNPRQYPQSTDVSQYSQDVPNRRFGNKASAQFGGRQKNVGGLEPSKSEEVSDDLCRRAVSLLNTLRLKRVENLGDGYDCLEGLVFTPTVKNVLDKYMDGMTTACTRHRNLAMDTSADVEKALAGTDTSGLRASFGHALSLSIPPLTLYCNHRPNAYLNLIFGVPLVNLTANRDNVPNLIRLCVEEVEKRGLNTKGIYWVGHPHRAEVLEASLQRRFENEQSFSFSSTDNIHTVAMLLVHYLWDIPEPLLVLSSQDYRNYRQNRARYTENDYSVLRSKIRELHPVHRASLEAVLQHLFLVSSHSDKNAMSVKALAGQFCYTILRGNTVSEGGVHKLIMEDLIENAHTLFDERTPLRVTSPYGSVLSPELSQSAEVGSTTRHRPGFVEGIPTSTQSSFSISHSDTSVEGRLTPLLGLSLSQTLKDGTGTTTQEQVIPWARGTQAVETLLDGSPLEVVSLPPTSATEWWLPHPGLHQRPEAPTIPPSRPESALSSTSDFSLSAASLISGTEFPSSPAASFLSGTTDSPPSPAATLLSSMGTFSPTISERF
ncbi:hypothetical protein EDB92DRAFT_1949282 [Lactarius akahatsu]|uniref:Rho-GAP domain-containing protein n=1 Tax=Lactarius akahatsu TaxID=416441 RepID=A0AAD4LB61_9AGAM|nr:hypothetical protein EDB92DRAFT_1949282 [Lactarius akahatsu]